MSATTADPTGGHVYRRLRVDERGAVTDRPRPDDASVRKAPSLFGLGILEQIPAAVIEAQADPNDRNDDGIKGRTGSGRFGWKARFVTLEDAVAAAFANELGLRSAKYLDTTSQPTSPGAAEVTDTQLRLTVAFIRQLPPLRPRHIDPREESTGSRTFIRIGCASCHRPRFEHTGAVPAYTDLLLHDMGPALADGLVEGRATGQTFRTPPLWGLSQTGPPYLHDGRANSVDTAIRDHGGEATESVTAYRALSPNDRAVLLQFLESR